MSLLKWIRVSSRSRTKVYFLPQRRGRPSEEIVGSELGLTPSALRAVWSGRTGKLIPGDPEGSKGPSTSMEGRGIGGRRLGVGGLGEDAWGAVGRSRANSRAERSRTSPNETRNFWLTAASKLERSEGLNDSQLLRLRLAEVISNEFVVHLECFDEGNPRFVTKLFERKSVALHSRSVEGQKSILDRLH